METYSRGGSSKHRSKIALFVLAAALTGSLVYAGVMISTGYIVTMNAVTNGGAAAASSASYNIRAGALGQNVSGGAQSPMYRNSGGFTNQAAPAVITVPANVSAVYVSPNPFKPNSPGRFQAGELTFRKLPATATIKVFAITGKQVAELHKTDTAVDYYRWDAVTSYGEKLTSGVYLYYITAPNGGKAKGKFAVIR